MGERRQVHYLSPVSKTNLFHHVLANKHILLERISKYFAVNVDVTPDSSHVEQTTFLLRYLNLKDDGYEVQERFLVFAAVRGGRYCSINNGCLRRVRHSSE